MSKATTVISPNSHNIERLMLDSVSSKSFYIPCDLYAIRNMCHEIESISYGIRDIKEGVVGFCKTLNQPAFFQK